MTRAVGVKTMHIEDIADCLHEQPLMIRRA
jgi:hypothetical protein